MKILKLPNGHLSAEFSGTSWSSLANKLRRFGALQEKLVADVHLLNIGEARFVRLDEWDGPALIATNTSADRILTRIVRPTVAATKQKRFVRSSSPIAARRLRRASAQRQVADV